MFIRILYDFLLWKYSTLIKNNEAKYRQRWIVRTWIVYEDNKVGGGVYAKVVSFADIQTIVSTFPSEQYGSKMLQDSTLIMDETIYEKVEEVPLGR